MNPKQSKLQHKQQEEQTADLQQSACIQAAQEFASVEQMLRKDAAMTDVPATVEARLSQSVQQHPPPQRSWWNRWRKP